MSDSTNRIHTFFHCGACHRQKPRHLSAREWNRTETGITPEGLQTYCLRCHRTVVELTPEQLQKAVEQGPRCSCCPDGRHSN